MKKLLLTLILVMSVGLGLFAQQLTYQAVIRDANQQLVVNTPTKTYLTITFATRDPYRDTVVATTNIHGLLTFDFGDASLSGRDWEGAKITTTVMNNANNSIVYVNNLTRPVSAVPYALSVNGQSIQNYLDANHYIDADSVRRTIRDTANALRATIGTGGGGVADCNAVNDCVANALGDNNSILNQAIDTIANNVATNVTSNYLTTNNYVTQNTLDGHHYLTSDSTVIITMQSNITTNATNIATLQGASHSHANKALLDTYTQTEANLADAVAKKHEHSNASVLEATTATFTIADETKLDGIAEGAEVNVNADWNATSGDAQILNKPSIPAAANNATITIQKNGADVDNFTVNANTDKSINILVPTAVSELTDASNYVTASGNNTLSGDNAFTGKNTFSDTVTVPSGFTFGTTNSSTCGNVAVNACDLLTIFDSIQRRMNNMEQTLQSEINHLRDTLNRLRAATAPIFNAMTFVKTDSSLQATVDFSDGGATITNYRYCISTNSDMSGETCVDSANNSCTFKNLLPGVTYYLTATATNLKGGTTSAVESATTDYSAPALGGVTPTPESNTEISVSGSLANMGGAPSTRVKVCAYANPDYSDTPICGSDSVITSAPKDYKVSVSGLAKNTHYYLAVIANNGQKKDTVKTDATTLNINVTITSNRTDTIANCGRIDTTVTYTAAVTGIVPTTYAWSVNGADSTEVTGETLTVHYTTTTTGYRANTVKCTVNGVSCTDTTVTQVKTVPTLGLCEECSDGSITVKTKTNVASIVWRNSSNDSVSNNMTSLAMSASIPAGIYTATAKSSNGCTATRTATLGNAIAHPCSVTRGLNQSDNTTHKNYEWGTTAKLDSVSDHQGNVYRVVQIGNQCWLAENMRCTSSPKGNLNLGGSNTSYYKAYYYDYSKQTLLSLRERGYLYNWAGALDTNATSYISASFTNRRGICPQGWHIPTDAEWATMEQAVAPTATDINTSSTGYQGSSTDLAVSLSGGCDWSGDGGTGKTPNSYSNSNRNSSGFSALPAGYCYGSSFSIVGYNAYFWSATSYSSYYAYGRNFYYSSEYVYRYSHDKNYGFSVRCVRDN